MSNHYDSFSHDIKIQYGTPPKGFSKHASETRWTRAGLGTEMGGILQNLYKV